MELFFSLYGSALLKGFFGTFILLAGITLLARPSQKKLRFGGIALVVGFLLALWQSDALVFPLSWQVFCGALIFALLIGVWDDVRNLHWLYQLGAQLAILTSLYVGGVKILSLTHPLGGVFLLDGSGFFTLSFVLFLAWGLLVLNAVNWLDGSDGLCGSVMLVTYVTVFALSLSPEVYQPSIAILLAAAIGATTAFLVYNLPSARIIAGTSGTLFFGVIIIFVSVVAGTKIATTLLVLALPITDAAFVLFKRLVQKRSLFNRDQEHLHHVLRKRGWSEYHIVAMYFLITLLITGIALHTVLLGKLTAIILVFGILGILLSFFHFQEKIPAWSVWLGAIIGAGFLTVLFVSARFDDTQNIFVAGQWYKAEIAQTTEERTQGLSNRERDSLCNRCGMVFLFPESQPVSFWMKDMQFSIDILWIQNEVVVAKNENLSFPSLESFNPGVSVDTVLELPAGSAQNIPIGAKVYQW